jgi:nitrogen fixation protein FixH
MQGVIAMSASLAERAHMRSQLVRNERRSRWFWLSLIVGFFAIDFTIAAIAITMAASDPSFRSIPGYGERAVAWDIRQQRKQVSEELGWQLRVVRAEPMHDAIELTIADAKGQPISGCKGTFRLYHYTRVAEQLHGPWLETEAGSYRAKVEVTRPGLWQMELDIHGPNGEAFWKEQSLRWMDESSQKIQMP